jgi:hypothetical protein
VVAPDLDAIGIDSVTPKIVKPVIDAVFLEPFPGAATGIAVADAV